MLFVLNAIELKKAKTRGMMFSNFEAMKRVARQMGQPKHLIWLILKVVLLMMLTFALAGTTIWYNTDKGQVDFVIVLDVSASMSASDVDPTRLDAAKQAAQDFVDRLRKEGIESNIAIVTFSGVALVHQDFTFDHREAIDAIETVYISDIPGTAIGNAIITSANILNPRTGIKTVVLLTDGQSNVGIDVNRAIKYAKDRAITVNTIGIATKEGATFGNLTSVSELDEDTLIHIADSTEGEYYIVEDRTEISEAFRNLAKAPAGKVGIKLAPFMMIGIVILIFFEWLLVITRYRVIP